MSRRATLINHVFELAVATAFFFVGLAYFNDQHAAVVSSPVHRYVGNWQYVWSALLIASAPGIWFGIFTNRPRHRVAALIVLASGLTMMGVAAVSYGTMDLRSVNYFIFAAACISRAAHIGSTFRRRYR